MKESEAQIRELSAMAAQLSHKATEAFRQRDFTSGRQLMAQAVAASKDCQKLIREHIEQPSSAS